MGWKRKVQYNIVLDGFLERCPVGFRLELLTGFWDQWLLGFGDVWGVWQVRMPFSRESLEIWV